MPVAQASVLEELAQYWMAKQNYDKAEASCWEALDLLEAKDEPILRARLYRMLGRIAERTGSVKLARNYYRLSLHLFRRLRAAGEVEETTACLAALDAGDTPGGTP